MRRAKQEGAPFQITPDDVVIPAICPVLGIVLKCGNGKPVPCSPTLDRINSLLGYVKGNVMVISFKANTIKSNATPEELRKIADFYEHL